MNRTRMEYYDWEMSKRWIILMIKNKSPEKKSPGTIIESRELSKFICKPHESYSQAHYLMFLLFFHLMFLHQR